MNKEQLIKKNERVLRLIAIHGPICYLCDKPILFAAQVFGEPGRQRYVWGGKGGSKWVYFRLRGKVERKYTVCRQGTLDHVIPLSRGGKDTEDNLRPCCLECNMNKGNFVIGDLEPPSAASS